MATKSVCLKTSVNGNGKWGGNGNGNGEKLPLFEQKLAERRAEIEEAFYQAKVNALTAIDRQEKDFRSKTALLDPEDKNFGAQRDRYWHRAENLVESYFGDWRQGAVSASREMEWEAVNLLGTKDMFEKLIEMINGRDNEFFLSDEETKARGLANSFKREINRLIELADAEKNRLKAKATSVFSSAHEELKAVLASA